MVKDRLKIDVKREVTKASGKKCRQIDTVGSHVLKKVPKGYPKGSKLEPEAEPNSSKIDALASRMQQSFVFLSQGTMEVGINSKSIENLFKMR